MESGLLGRLASPGVKSEAGDKKKKKRAHDPNAPKRALTPYFLFMQSNRSRIAAELGPNASAAEVNEEGLRRWTNMQDSEKEVCSLFFIFVEIRLLILMFAELEKTLPRKLCHLPKENGSLQSRPPHH